MIRFSSLKVEHSKVFENKLNYKIQRSLILPTVNEHFNRCIQEARQLSSETDQVLLCDADGRFDSPGKSAKYCTYWCQAPSTGKIVVTSTAQTIKGIVSSPLALQGFITCLEELANV